MNRTPDVEVIFKFNGTRTNPAVDGYRPAHLITDSYLTTGVHHRDGDLPLCRVRHYNYLDAPAQGH